MADSMEEFDYESAPNTHKLAAGDTDIYIVNPEGIFKRILDGSGDVYHADNAVYNGGRINTSSLTIIEKDVGQDNNRLIYTGNVTYNPDNVIEDKNLFTVLNDHVAPTHDFFNSYFDNARLTKARLSAAMFSISHSVISHEIISANEVIIHSTKLPDLTVKMEAPTFLSLGGEKATLQFYDLIQTHVLSINALTKVLNGTISSEVFVVTPDGRYFPKNLPKKPAPTIIDLQPPLQKAIEAPKPLEPPEVEQSTNELLLLDHIGGLETLRAELKNVALSFLNAESMEKWGATRPQGILLHGPPGTGKTTLAQALANEIDGELWEIKGTEIYERWLGSSEKNMEAIFEEARRKTHPTVMLLDEFEAMIDSSNDGRPSRSTNSVVGVFKKEAIALRETNPNIIMVATTNYIERIDESLIRAGRFDIKAYVPLPDESARLQIFAMKISDSVYKLRSDTFIPYDQDVNAIELARLTDGKSGADITEILRRAAFAKAMEEVQNGSERTAPISQSDLVKIIHDMRTS